MGVVLFSVSLVMILVGAALIAIWNRVAPGDKGKEEAIIGDDKTNTNVSYAHALSTIYGVSMYVSGDNNCVHA